MPLVYAPLLSGAVAVVAGVGVNLYTDSDANTTVGLAGLGFLILSLSMLAWGSLALLRIVSKGPHGLNRVRHKLHEYADLRQAAPELTQALAWVRRMQCVGKRYIHRASSLTMRRWAIQRAWWLTPLAIMYLADCLTTAVLTQGLVRGKITIADQWPSLSYAGLALIVAPATAILGRNNRRWWLRQLGKELVAEAERAEKVLLRRPPAPTSLRQRVRRWLQGQRIRS